MTGLTLALVAFIGLIVLGDRWARQGDRALADLGNVHEPADCLICQQADDAGVAARIDFDIWAGELRADA